MKLPAAHSEGRTLSSGLAGLNTSIGASWGSSYSDCDRDVLGHTCFQICVCYPIVQSPRGGNRQAVRASRAGRTVHCGGCRGRPTGIPAASDR